MKRSLSLLVCLVVVSGALTSCKKKTAAEGAIEEVNRIREVKRVNAIKYYRQLAKEFPDSPHVAEANDHATKLEALVKK